MARKSIIFLLSLVMIFSMAAGVSSSRAQSMTEIKMVYWTGPESLAMADVIDKYNKDQGKKDGVQVQMVLFGREGFWERQETIMAAKSSEVDIFYTASYYVGRQEGALEPLASYVKGIEKGSIFIPS